MATPRKNGLGRGLGELFGAAEIEVSSVPSQEDLVKKQDLKPTDSNAIIYLDINDITPNENQPRQIFDDEKIDELASSIETYGVIQPIILRKMDKGYEIIAGERRWRAARKAKLKHIPCIIKTLSDEEHMIISIIENMQRENLNPIEEAEALEQMVEKYGMSHEEVSKSVGKSRAYITNSLRLLKLTPAVRQMILDGKLTNGHGRAIVAIESEETQEKIGKTAYEQGLSVREVEKVVQDIKNPKKKPEKRKKSADVKKVEEELKEALGTKVNLKHSGNRGKIEIEYYTREDLERLIDFLKSAK